MKRLKNVYRVILFLAIFTACFIVLTDILKDKRFSPPYDVANKVTGFYEEPKDSLDFVFIGSSQLYYSICPAVLWRDYGIASYDFAANEQPFWISYYYMKEALQYQKPKAIVIDVRYAFFADPYQKEGATRINLDNIRFSMNKIDMINASVQAKDRATFLIDMIYYHGNWKNLSEAHFKYLYWSKQNPNKGYTFEPSVKSYPAQVDPSYSQTTEKRDIPPRSLEYLNKIIDYTKQNNISLILIKTPDSDPDGQLYYNSVADVAAAKGVPFINFNTIMPGVAHPDYVKADEVTRYMGEYLKQHYTLTDHRNDQNYTKEWDADLTYYNQEVNAARLQAENYIQNYLPLMNNPNYITIISGKDDASANMDDSKTAQLQALGFKEDLRGKTGYSYLGILDGGKVVYEQNQNQLLQYDGTVDSLRISALSAGSGVGNASSIKLNGNEFSCNQRGLNIVVYDKILGRIVGCVSFDTHDKSQITGKNTFN